MVRSLLIRGMLAGVVAGLLAFGFAKVFGEPAVDTAISFEALMDQAKGEQPEPEIVSREVQSTIGLFTAIVVYSAAFGGLFALAFAYAHGRIGNLSPRATSALLAAAAFLVLVVVPQIKYPANPPSVGDPDTITERTILFTTMIIASLAAMWSALLVRRKLLAAHGGWNASLIGAGVFVALIVIVQIVLPTVNEVPEQFPAVTLWQFRITSIGIEAILWTTIGLMFGVMAEKVVAHGRLSTAHA